MSQAIPRGWVTIADLARERGVHKSAVLRRLAKFEKLGAVEVSTSGRAKIVNRARFERACAVTTDAVRESNGSRPKRARMAAKARTEREVLQLADEQARRTRAQAELAELRLAQLRSELLAAADVQDAMARAAGEIVRVLEGLPNRAADFGATFNRDGEPALRRMLRDVVYDLRTRLAGAMRSLAAEGEALLQ